MAAYGDQELHVDFATVNSLTVREYAVRCLITMPVRQHFPAVLRLQLSNDCRLG